MRTSSVLSRRGRISSFAPSSPQAACPTAAPNAADLRQRRHRCDRTSEGGDVPLERGRRHTSSRARRSRRPVADAASTCATCRTFDGLDGHVRRRGSDTFTYETIERASSVTASGYWLFRWPGEDGLAGLGSRRRTRPARDRHPRWDSGERHGHVLQADQRRTAASRRSRSRPGPTWNSTSVDLDARPDVPAERTASCRVKSVDVCGDARPGLAHPCRAVTGRVTKPMIDSVVSPEHGGQVISTTIDGDVPRDAVREGQLPHRDSSIPNRSPRSSAS